MKKKKVWMSQGRACQVTGAATAQALWQELRDVYKRLHGKDGMARVK